MLMTGLWEGKSSMGRPERLLQVSQVKTAADNMLDADTLTD